MYRADKYDIHDSSLEEFCNIFNSHSFIPELKICPNETETFGNDGYFYINNTRLFGFDWERRDNHFSNGELKFKTIGQFERKIAKASEISLSLQCDSEGTVVATAWHDDFRNSPVEKRDLATSDPNNKQTNGKVRYTAHFHIYKYSTDIKQMKTDILTAIYNNKLDHSCFNSNTTETVIQNFVQSFTNCPQCGQPLFLRLDQNNNSWFKSCSSYPDCSYSCSIR